MSILIPTLISRKENYSSLVDQLIEQRYFLGLTEADIEFLPCPDDGFFNIGFKRNWLLNKSKGEYVCFFDDDDEPAKDYIKNLMEGISKGVDCCSLRGVYTVDGNNPELFEHSIKYSAYKTTENPIKYERFPNHLNCIKASIAKQFKFPEINYGEDTAWAVQIFNSGLIKTEHYIDSVMYHYKYISKK